MPERPDVTVHVECLTRHVGGKAREGGRVRSAFLLRTADPALSRAEGRVVLSLRRPGKRIVIGFEGEIFLVFHMMDDRLAIPLARARRERSTSRRSTSRTGRFS
jgi:formamidopyrimidine-DNA glycosylase